MKNIIDVETLMNNVDKYIIIDLRSPLEYEKGTIIGAINIPILDNESRKIIGTLYKNNKEKAYEEGLKVGTDRLPNIYKEVKKLKENNLDKEIVFFCFRGGTRSKSVQTMLELMKISSYKLDGGYKAYRRYVLNNLPYYLNKIKWIVLTGNTGTGKTIILKELLKQNYPVIDLEGLANNRGSIFGSIGLNNVVNQRDFDSKLLFRLKQYVDNNIDHIFVECESKRIGNINLPFNMHDTMKKSRHILIEIPIEQRIDIIRKDYQPENIEKDMIKQLIISNEHFKKVLGKKWVNQMLQYIESNNYNEFIKRMLLDYYDKLYLKSQIEHKYDMVISSDDKKKIIDKIKHYYDKLLIK